VKEIFKGLVVGTVIGTVSGTVIRTVGNTFIADFMWWLSKTNFVAVFIYKYIIS